MDEPGMIELLAQQTASGLFASAGFLLPNITNCSTFSHSSIQVRKNSPERTLANKIPVV
jgi:hypothetical protein